MLKASLLVPVDWCGALRVQALLCRAQEAERPVGVVYIDFRFDIEEVEDANPKSSKRWTSGFLLKAGFQGSLLSYLSCAQITSGALTCCTLVRTFSEAEECLTKAAYWAGAWPSGSCSYPLLSSRDFTLHLCAGNGSGGGAARQGAEPRQRGAGRLRLRRLCPAGGVQPG